MLSKRNVVILLLLVLFGSVYADSAPPSMSFSMVHRIIKDEDLCSVLYLDYAQYAEASSSTSGLPASSIPGMTISSVDVSNAQGLKFAVLSLKTFGAVTISSLRLDFTALTDPPQVAVESASGIIPFSMKIYRVTNQSNAIYTTPQGENETGAANEVPVISSAETIGEANSWKYDPIAVLEITINTDNALIGTYGGTIRCHVDYN